MSFNFKWPTFSKEFHESAAQMLDNALNKGPKPKVIADDIKVEELGMGTIPPELEILEIGDLGTDRFRGIFRLTYAGDAHLVLKTKVQANPLSKPNRPDIGLFPSSTASRGILFAAAPLVVPMHLRLSDVKLRAIVVLVVSKAKGITLVFKNDPLESVQVSSTFDSVAVLQKYLQQEIETQLREMFREDLPGIIHRLSQRWLSGEAKHEQEEARLRREGQPQQQQQFRETPVPRSTSDPHGGFETASAPGGPAGRHNSSSIKSKSSRRRPSISGSAAAAPASALRKTPSVSPQRPRSAGRRPKHSAKAASMSAAPLFNELLSSSSASAFASSFPDIENHDPTYGLRPDELPMHSGFSGLGKLAQRASGGLKDLTNPPQEETPAPQQLGRSVSSDSDDPVLAESSGVDTDVSDHAEGQGESEDYSSHDDVSDSMTDEEEDDDVPDLDPDTSADTSIDYTRFGYPPASAAFSDTHEVNKASSIIFDDEPGPSSLRKGGRKRADSTGRASSTRHGGLSGAGGGSIRSTRTSSSRGRRKRASAVEYETIPAVGGGTITRPRVYHIASKVQPPEMDWDDESTARPSQYGGAGSSRTGGATRYGSEMGSTTMGAQSSRTNTVRGLSSPMLDAMHYPDGSEESLLELPPESMHSSDRSNRMAALAQGWRSGSSASSASASARQSSSGLESGAYSSGLLSRANSASYIGGWDHSGSSSAPTSLPPSGLGSASELGFQQRAGVDARTAGQSTRGQESGGGIRFSKGKNVARPRPTAAASLDRAGFVTSAGLSGRSSQPRDVPGLASSPDKSGTGYYSNGGGRSNDLSTSPFSHRDLLSTSPSYQGSPRSHFVTSASQALHQAAGSGVSGGTGTTKLSIDASAHFADLVTSNHTLSPFTRSMEHFTVRSAPVTPGWQHGGGGGGSVVGSAAASSSHSAASGSGTGTGSGSGSHGGMHRNSSSVRTSGSGGVANAHLRHAAAASSLSSTGGNSPARRRRTFQLGGGSSQPSTPVQPTGGSSANSTPRAPGQSGFAPYAGDKARGFATPPFSSASSSSSGVAGSGHRRSRPGSMGPPSEAARLNAARWEAIRE